MRKLTVAQDSNAKYSLFCIQPSDYVNARVLATGVAEVETVPTEAKKVLFSSTGNFFAKRNSAAAIAVADVDDGTGSVLNPEGWVVTAGDTIGVIAPANCVLTLEYFI
jgi:hypothetical protein